MRILIVFLGIILAANGLEAQRNCKKGIPCGGSCISPTKTCRIGTVSSPKEKKTTAASDTLLSDGRPVPKRLLEGSRASPAQAAPPVALYDWIASVDGAVYYSRICNAAKQKIIDDEAVYFRNEEEARAAGYKRSKIKGC